LARSLAEQERAANHLALGELQQDALQEKPARTSFEKALTTDDTPLSLFDLAKLEQLFGHVEQSKSRAEQVAAFQDESWMFNFGVTKDKFLRDQEELAADIHHSALLMLDFRPRSTPWDWALWAWDKASEGLQWFYHDQQWKALLVKTGNASLEARNTSEAWVNLTLAHRDLPRVGLKYLALSRQQELPRNALSRPSYLLEEGLVAGDERLLETALKSLQVPGENSDRARALAKLANLRAAKGQTTLARQALSDLFDVAGPTMLAQGLAVPVQSAWFGSDQTEVQAWRAVEASYAWQSGWDLGNSNRPGVRWNLSLQVITAGSPQVFWTLRDVSGEARRSGRVSYDPQKKMEALASILKQLHSSE
jgi:hypothetical protein